MSVVVFAINLLETAVSVVGSVAAGTGKPITRLYDRQTGPQYEIATQSQVDIDIDLGAAATPVTGWGLSHHNITTVTVSLYADDTFPPTTLRDSVDPASADMLRTFTILTKRYWRVRIPTMTAVAKIGEMLLGIPRTITQNPHVRQSGKHTVPNVRRLRSAGGHPVAAQLGPARTRLPMGWRGMSNADVATIEAIISESTDSAKPVLVKDVSGVVRWGELLVEAFEPTPMGDGLHEAALTFESVGLDPIVAAVLPSGFAADTVPNLTVWLKADAITGLSDGNSFETWSDSSGSAHHVTQSDPGKRPTYRVALINGKPGVRFDGVNDYLKASAFTLNQPATVFLVAKWLTHTTGSAACDGEAKDSMVFYIYDNTKYSVFAGADALYLTPLDNLNWHIYTAIVNGASSELRKDGGAPGTGDPGANNAGGFTIGSKGDGAVAFSHLEIAEVLVYAAAVSAANREVVEDYLGAKYGITVP